MNIIVLHNTEVMQSLGKQWKHTAGLVNYLFIIFVNVICRLYLILPQNFHFYFYSLIVVLSKAIVVCAGVGGEILRVCSTGGTPGWGARVRLGAAHTNRNTQPSGRRSGRHSQRLKCQTLRLILSYFYHWILVQLTIFWATEQKYSKVNNWRYLQIFTIVVCSWSQ